MGDSLAKTYTSYLRNYDRDLYASRNRDGVICVYRRGRRFEPVLDSDELTLYATVESPEYLFALTETWKTNAAPRQWGIDRVLERVREIDVFQNPEHLEKIERENSKVDESKSRDFRNQTEAMLLDNKRSLQKAFSDINTSTLSKDDARRRRKETGKEIKYGNR